MVARPIVMFLEGEGTDARSRTVFDVLAMDDVAMERTHDFIQWLFPLPEPSAAVPGSPVLTPGDIQAIRVSELAPIAFRQCVDTLIMGGGMAMLGIPSKPMETDWGAIILKALTIKGVYGREMFTTWRKMLGLLKAGLDLTPLITHQMSYDRYQEGFEAMRSGQSGKVVLNWDKAA